MYTEKFGHLTSVATAAITSTGVASPTKAIIIGCNIGRIAALVTTTVSTTASAQVQFIYRPTYGSASGAVTLGTLVIPTGTAAGTLVYKDISPDPAGSVSTLLPGGQIVYNVSVAASSAGSAIFGEEVLDSPLNAKAVTSMLASS